MISSQQAFVFALAFVGLLASCMQEETPTHPTWIKDIRPIMMANCVRCHGYPASQEAPTSFRLDMYDIWTNDQGKVIYGAGTMANYMVRRISYKQYTAHIIEESGVTQMPPGFKITERQQEILKNWWTTREPGFPIHPPNKGVSINTAPPSARLTSSMKADENGIVPCNFEISGDGNTTTTGMLIAKKDGKEWIISRELHSGRGTILWNSTGRAPGAYDIIARVKDGYSESDISWGTFTIEHDNTVPWAKFVSLNSYTIVADSDSPFAISLNVGDADGTPVSVKVEAFLGDTVVTIADLENVSDKTVTVSLDTDGVEESSEWRIRAIVSDGELQRTVLSRTLHISHRSTTEFGGFGEPGEPPAPGSIAEIILGACANCHSDGGRVPGLNYDFFQYKGAPEAPGVFDVRGNIYERVILLGNMPPLSSPLGGDPMLTRPERDRLFSWLLGGSPE